MKYLKTIQDSFLITDNLFLRMIICIGFKKVLFCRGNKIIIAYISGIFIKVGFVFAMQV